MLEVGGLLKAGVSVGGYANRGAEFVGGLKGPFGQRIGDFRSRRIGIDEPSEA